MKHEFSSIVTVVAMTVASSGVLAAERARPTDEKAPQSVEEEIQKSSLPETTKAERRVLHKPDDRKARIEAARAHLAQGADKQSNVDAAQGHALAVLAENPQDVESLLLAGQTSLLKNDLLAAARYYRSATLAAPDNAAAFLGLGDALTRMRDEPGANAAFERYRALKGMAPLQKTETGK